MEAGRKLGATNVGYSAVDCLRIERSVAQLGKELTSFITAREAGLMQLVQLDKVGPIKISCLSINNIATFCSLILHYLLKIIARVQSWPRCTGNRLNYQFGGTVQCHVSQHLSKRWL